MSTMQISSQFYARFHARFSNFINTEYAPDRTITHFRNFAITVYYSKNIRYIPDVST